MSIFCLFCIFVIYFSIFFFTVLSHFCKLIFSFFHFLFFITQYGFFPFIMVIWLQRGVICMKTFFKNLTFTFLCLGISTILAFFFFNLGQKNSVNTALIYILALILIAQNTTSYWYGAAASVFCVIAANYFFTYPYFKLNFILDGYPVTFIGMLAISLITSATASMLKKQKAIASERERKLAEAEREKIHANLLRAVSHDLRTPLTSIIGSSASYLDDAQCPDVIILDLGLPDMNGNDIIQEVRTWTSTPIIVISARSAEKEKVLALDQGADDYITKPFGTSELLARIRTSLRHSNRLYTTDSLYIRPYRYEDLVLDFSKRELTLDKQPVHLTPIEYKIVSYLAQNSGKVMTYAAIISNVWGLYADDDNKILRVNMANIRRKLEKDPAQPKYIFTEVGVGYRMQEDSSEND